MAAHSAAKGKLIAVIGDEDTCVGFLLGGIGELNKSRQTNFMVVEKNTPASEIEDTFKNFVKREDIDIILINQNIAEMIHEQRVFSKQRNIDRRKRSKLDVS
ncbi:v-type proton ATPase subunit F [Nephila pilipes]|uniref:V-type proton ATPase subunit F n=1 Tax=Nephila pilipes TaxID=299642 RepID=A0A8X6UE41_NEPPI|nr:v-type proton ATPase subunit F [Nephila pilipes]